MHGGLSAGLAAIVKGKSSRETGVQCKLEREAKATTNQRASNRIQDIPALEESIGFLSMPKLRLNPRGMRVILGGRRDAPGDDVIELGLLIATELDVDGVDVDGGGDGEHHLAADDFPRVVLLLVGVDEDLVGMAEGLEDDHGLGWVGSVVTVLGYPGV